MRCNSCSHENPAGTRFCLACGEGLDRICPRCNADVPATARFCGQCGASVDPAPLPPTAPHSVDDAERRQLTLLFCDLVGSTELANRLDPEEWQTLAADYHRAATVASTRFGGHVAKYLGDGVVVYFGYPQAHEDDAERGVRAGLAILDEMRELNNRVAPELGVRLAVRVGIHTGEVVVGRGSGADYEVFGDTPNLAARLQSVAAPDTVVVSAATLRLVHGIFVTEDLGEQELKGFTTPVAVYRVVRPSGVRSRLDVGEARLTPLIGREAEMRVLSDSWTDARNGKGGAVMIGGDAGMGKSRLVRDVRETLAEQAYTWLECRCTPYTQHSAFHPVIELVEHRLGFASDDGPSGKISKLETALRTADFSLPETVPLFASLLSIPFEDRYARLRISPETQREKTLDALVRWTTALCALQPVLLLVEDAHWCDPSSLEFFRQLIARSRNSRILVLLAARTEFEPDWVRTEGLAVMRLERLDEAEALRIVGHLNPDSVVHDALARAIVERADGNPLYLEELVRTMLESGRMQERQNRYRLSGRSADLAIPETLQDSLTARLDRLGAAREVAQRAAVIGREFSYQLVSATAGFDGPTLDAALERLMDAGLLFAHGRPPKASYTFKHALIQEAAYNSLLRRTRQQLHGRIAETIEKRFPQRAEASPEVVARHYEAAGSMLPALEHYQRAGEHAAARSACEEAIVQLRNALRMLEGIPEGPERSARELALQIDLGSPLVSLRGFPHPETRIAYERAVVLCDAGKSIPIKYLASALGGLSICTTSAGDFNRGIALAERLMSVRGKRGEDAHLLQAHIRIAVPRFLQARFATAVEHCNRALALYDPARHADYTFNEGVDHGVAANVWSMWGLWFLGRPDSAVIRAEAALKLARQLEHPHSLSVALLWNTIHHYWRREMDLTCDSAAETIAVAEPQGFVHWAGIARAYRGAALVATGAGSEALVDVVDGLELAARAHQGGAPFLFGMLAEACQAIGDLDRAAAALEQGSSIAAMTAQPLWDPEFKRLKGELVLRAQPDSEAEAENLFRQALDNAAALGAQPLALRAATSLARVLKRRGELKAAATLLEPLYGGFVEGQDLRDLADARSLLEELGVVTGSQAHERRNA